MNQGDYMKKYKKSILTCFPILILAIFLLLFFSSKDITDFVDEKEINCIGVRDGGTGDYIKVTDQEDIKSILTYMENISFRRKPSMPWGGYSYSLTFYNDDKELTSIVYATEKVDIDGSTYSCNNDNDASMESMLQGLKHSKFEKSE